MYMSTIYRSSTKIYVLRRDVFDIFANNWVPSDEFVFVHHSAPFMEKISGLEIPTSFFRVQNYLGPVSLSAENLTKSEA